MDIISLDHGADVVSIGEVLSETVAQIARPHQVRWSVQTMATLRQALAPRLAHTMAELIDAAQAKSPAVAVTVTVRSDRQRLVVTISDRAANCRPGQLTLGAKPAAVLSLVRRLGASLTASPRQTGAGTEAILTVPLD
jgi:hypothetical protein